MRTRPGSLPQRKSASDYLPKPSRMFFLPCRYFSVSTTYRRTTLVAFSRWGARSVQAFDL